MQISQFKKLTLVLLHTTSESRSTEINRFPFWRRYLMDHRFIHCGFAKISANRFPQANERTSVFFSRIGAVIVSMSLGATIGTNGTIS